MSGRRHAWRAVPGRYPMRCVRCSCERRSVRGEQVGQPGRVAVTVYRPAGAGHWFTRWAPCGSSIRDWLDAQGE